MPPGAENKMPAGHGGGHQGHAQSGVQHGKGNLIKNSIIYQQKIFSMSTG